MTAIVDLIQQLQDTDVVSAQMQRALAGSPNDAISLLNANAIRKRRSDLERRLSNELRTTQSDLVQYHVERASDDRYPVLAVARAISGFQELVTSVFDAIRTMPKQRYRPAPESIALSTLDFAMALPTGSVVISLSVENERLLAIKSDLDRTFDEVFSLLHSAGSDDLRGVAASIGIASIAKAHDWAESSSAYGLNTRITVKKDQNSEISFSLTGEDALKLKEAIEEKSDKKYDPCAAVGELVGIDVDRPKTYFHIKTRDGENIEGKLADTFPVDQEWAVHITYAANLIKVTTVRYATGEEKVDWLLANLSPFETD
jgi:hypothetical protein